MNAERRSQLKFEQDYQQHIEWCRELITHGATDWGIFTLGVITALSLKVRRFPPRPVLEEAAKVASLADSEMLVRKVKHADRT